ncbi:MAG: hypothetical protein J6A94_04925 [Lachnospiraceae bacterium]|nr:hypothetical protein [Lachnospiraceae bacterium]
MMKKKISKMVLSCMAVAIMVPFLAGGTSVQAQELNVSVQPRAALCDDCGVGQMKTTYGEWSEWSTVGEIDCTHYPYGTDLIKERTRLITSICNYCGAGLQSIGKQQKSECHGYH